MCVFCAFIRPAVLFLLVITCSGAYWAENNAFTGQNPWLAFKPFISRPFGKRTSNNEYILHVQPSDYYPSVFKADIIMDSRNKRQQQKKRWRSGMRIIRTYLALLQFLGNGGHLSSKETLHRIGWT